MAQAGDLSISRHEDMRWRRYENACEVVQDGQINGAPTLTVRYRCAVHLTRLFAHAS